MEQFLIIDNQDSALFLVTFIEFVLVGIVIYALYVAFGPPSEDLRDPFEEHEE